MFVRLALNWPPFSCCFAFDKSLTLWSKTYNTTILSRFSVGSSLLILKFQVLQTFELVDSKSIKLGKGFVVAFPRRSSTTLIGKISIHYLFLASNDVQQSCSNVPESFSIHLTYHMQNVNENDWFKHDQYRLATVRKGSLTPQTWRTIHPIILPATRRDVTILEAYCIS